MLSRSIQIAIAAVGGFVVTAGLIVVYWLSAVDSSDCNGDECALEWAAVVTWAVAAGLLVGVSCGFAMYAVHRRSVDGID